MKDRGKTIKAFLGGLVVLLICVFSCLWAERVFAQEGTWTTRASMPTARNGLSLGVHNSVIYAVGGWDGFHRTTVEAYDTTTDTWSTKASMLGPQTHAASGVIDGVLYLAGGTNCCVEINTFTAYDITTNSWTFKPSMPTTRQGAAGGVINGKLYVAGGINSQNQPNQPALATLEMFDPATNTWSSLAPMPTARFSLAAGVVNGALYVVGGRTGTSSSPITLTTTVEAFDPATNTWTTKAPMLTARASHAVAVVNGILYVIGGSDINGQILNTVEAYNPVTNTWATEASMPTSRYFLRAEPVGGTLYAVGGYNSVTGNLSANEAFTPGGGWTTNYLNDFESVESESNGLAASGTLSTLTRVSLPTDSGGLGSANQSMWLGRLGHNVAKSSTMPETVTLALSGLVPGSLYSVAFDLLIGGSWDGSAGYYGPDRFSVTVLSGAVTTPLVDTTFSNCGVNNQLCGAFSPQTYSDGTPLGGTSGPTFAPTTGADAAFDTSGDYSQDYAIYWFGHGAGNPVLTFTAEVSTALLLFQRLPIASGDSPDEYWALDNISITSATGTLTLTVTKAGTGTGTVSSSPTGIACGADCTESYTAGTVVTLTATPDPGATFAGWGGDPDCSDGQVTLTATLTCTATFTAPTTGTLTVTTPPVSGPIMVDGTLMGTGSISIQLPAGNHTVSFGAVSGFTAPSPLSLTIPAGQTTSVTGTYTPLLPQLTLTVLTIGTGSGTVTSSPAGIACGVDCTESYASGTVVTLTATANPGATFVRWRGHADCADGQVTLSVAKTCAAVFTMVP